MKTAARSVTHRCGRCGIDTSAEFCRDCQAVDPEMTAGGLSARQYTAKVRVLALKQDLHEEEIKASLLVREQHRRQAARRAERLRRQIEKYEERLAA